MMLVFLMEVVYIHSSRHSDIGLVEVRTDVVKDEETTVLLEGGALQPASPTPKARSFTASTSIIRY